MMVVAITLLASAVGQEALVQVQAGGTVRVLAGATLLIGGESESQSASPPVTPPQTPPTAPPAAPPTLPPLLPPSQPPPDHPYCRGGATLYASEQGSTEAAPGYHNYGMWIFCSLGYIPPYATASDYCPPPSRNRPYDSVRTWRMCRANQWIYINSINDRLSPSISGRLDSGNDCRMVASNDAVHVGSIDSVAQRNAGTCISGNTNPNVGLYTNPQDWSMQGVGTAALTTCDFDYCGVMCCY